MADTSALVALLDERHPRHGAAAKALEQGFVTVTWGTLGEVSVVIRRLAKDAGLDGNRSARQAIAAICALAGFREAPTVPLDDVTRLYRKRSGLSFAGAWAMTVSMLFDEPLLTFDRNMKVALRRPGTLSALAMDAAVGIR